MKQLASAVSLNFLAKALIWNEMAILASNFVEICRTGGKWANQDYLRKYSTIFMFIPDLCLLNVNILRAYNKNKFTKIYKMSFW